MKIYAPVKDFNGLRNNVRFVNGVGETDDQRLLHWFTSHGYQIELDSIATSGYISVGAVEIPESITTVASTEPNFDSMTADELRNWGRANGFGAKIRNTRNKEKLLEIIRG